MIQPSRTRCTPSIRRLLPAVLTGLVVIAGTQANAGERAFDGDRSRLLSSTTIEGWRSPAVDVPELLREDEANRHRRDIPDRVGFPMQVDLSPSNSGTWEELPGGDRLWRLRIETENALWTVLGFDVFRLPLGAAMSVYDLDGRTIDGPYTALDIRKHGELWFPPIEGDTLVVELYWPRELIELDPALHLGTVSHGYKSWGALGRDPAAGNTGGAVIGQGFGDSGSCNIDTTCPEADEWQDTKRGVVLILVGGSGNCTGSLINTTAGDCRTYLLTADHCGENGPGTTIGFNFERPACGAGTPPPETSQTLTGGTLLADWSSSDFTLIEMDQAPPEEFGAYFIGWNRDPSPAPASYVIHHPSGDVKKISHDADPPVNGSNWGSNHWRIDDSTSDPAHRGYEWGTTEGGSSGSPLMDPDQRIIGQLHGGLASCSSDTYDEYGKVDASWTGGGTPSSRMSDWLDPAGTGATFVDGIDYTVCLFQPTGELELTRDLYGCSDTLALTLRDDNIAGSPATIDVSLSSGSETVAETVTLTQVEPGSGQYVGGMATTAAPAVSGDGLLSVGDAEIVTATYIDADDGAGGSNISVSDTAAVDCAAPVITNVQSSNVTGNSASVTWDTDEPADSSVTHGLVPPGSTTTTDDALVISHVLDLTGLAECSQHVYSVSSTDAAGNLAGDDDFGNFYGFETGRNVNPSYPSPGPAVPIPDNDPAGIVSTIHVSDIQPVVDVDVVVNVTHTFDGDLQISLRTPTGSSIQLSNRNGGTGENFVDTRFDDEAATPIGSGAAPYTGSFQPDQPLAAADGIVATGDWRLEIADLAGADLGTLDDWTLILTYPAQQCGPHGAYASHSAEQDDCTTGGASSGNGFWDAGEEIRFSLTVNNDGTDPLTGVSVQVQPQTPLAVMLDDQAVYANIPVGGSATSLAPHFTVRLPDGAVCGESLDFDVLIDTAAGSFNGSFSQTIGELLPGGGVALAEDFESGIPLDWNVSDGSGDGESWYLDDSSDPRACGNTDPGPPVTGQWAQVDSDCAGSGVSMDESLSTSTLDLSAAQTVTLEFDHFFRWYSGGLDEKADVDVRSSTTGFQWVNVARWQGASSANPAHAAIDLTAQAAGASGVEIRWHYYDADFEWSWAIDNVEVLFTAPGGCNMPQCLPSQSGPPPVPDGSAGTVPLRVSRLNAAGTRLEIGWDDQCASVGTNLLYGSLSSVSTYALVGAECAVAQPALWDPAPPGDLWFLLVGEDGAGAESSWGLATTGERNGASSSGMCGVLIKDLSGSCP